MSAVVRRRELRRRKASSSTICPAKVATIRAAPMDNLNLPTCLFTLELAKRLKDTTRATANAVRPGVIATNLGRHLPQWQVWALKTIGKPFTKTVGQGAATTCYVATAPALDTKSAEFSSSIAIRTVPADTPRIPKWRPDSGLYQRN